MDSLPRGTVDDLSRDRGGMNIRVTSHLRATGLGARLWKLAAILALTLAGSSKGGIGSPHPLPSLWASAGFRGSSSISSASPDRNTGPSSNHCSPASGSLSHRLPGVCSGVRTPAWALPPHLLPHPPHTVDPGSATQAQGRFQEAVGVKQPEGGHQSLVSLVSKKATTTRQTCWGVTAKV